MNRPCFHVANVIASVVIVVLISACFCFWNLDASSLGPRDESLHVSATQSMLHDGRWLIPRVNGAPYFGKPPFKMWMSTVPVSLMGESTFAFRSVDATLGVLTCIVLFFFTFSVTQSLVAGVFSVLGLLSCAGYVLNHGPRVAVQDAMLVFLFTSATILGAHAIGILGDTRGRLRSALFGGVVLGCALLTKSAAATVPIVVLGATWVLICLRDRQLLPGIRMMVIFTLAAFATATPYYYYQYVAPRGGFSTLVGYGVVARALEGFHNVDKPFFYLTRVFIDRVAIPPELLVLVLAFCATSFAWKRNRVSALALMWILVPIVGFSFAQSGLTWYIAPAFVGMSLGLGLLVHATTQWWSASRGMKRVGVLGIGGCGVALLLQSLLQVAGEITDLSAQERIGMQDAVEAMQPQLKDGGTVIVVSRGAFAFREHPYLAMLSPWIEKGGEEDGSLVDLSKPEAPLFVILPIERMRRIEKFVAPLAYRLLSPLEQRERGAMIAAYGVKEVPPGFKPIARRIVPSEMSPMAMYGVGEVGSFKGVPILVLRGREAAFALSADGLHERFGVTLSFRIAPRGIKERIPLGVSVNGKQRIAVELDHAGFTQLTVEVPPHTLHVGRNFLSLSFGEAIRGKDESRDTVDSAILSDFIIKVRWPDTATQE